MENKASEISDGLNPSLFRSNQSDHPPKKPSMFEKSLNSIRKSHHGPGTVEVKSQRVTQTWDPTAKVRKDIVEDVKIDDDLANELPEKGEISFELKKNILRRFFGKMEKGSLRGSTFTLMSSSIGAGILSLPYVIKLSGIIFGEILIILGALISFGSLVFLMEGTRLTGAPTFGALVSRTMGKPAEVFLNCIFLIYLIGACVTFIVIIATNFQQILFTFFLSVEEAQNVWIWRGTCLTVGLALIPLVIQKDLTSLRYFSILGCLGALYITAAIMVEAPVYVINDFFPKKYDLCLFSIHLFSAFGATIFGYTCQQIAIPVTLELINPTRKRLIKVSADSFVIYSHSNNATVALSFHFSLVLMIQMKRRHSEEP